MDGPGIVTTDKLNTCTPSSTYFQPYQLDAVGGMRWGSWLGLPAVEFQKQ